MSGVLSKVGQALEHRRLKKDSDSISGISPVNIEAFIYEFDPAGGADSFKKETALDSVGFIQIQLIIPHLTK
ncbi:hypothetical protein SAMN04487995_4393 [Dyadobacter koreensis]|uniref:Uncharacterized protein n=1 Tax=Dyadobacter koreensis TaxID=408657 RepID=A0A1H6YI04_9BACT|nr:hypothetical protein [Dyadobacter koreensis]SEJ38597.1 hypothetical protein SAMN04487995_4393 [Dyadobacter koreensis]